MREQFTKPTALDSTDRQAERTERTEHTEHAALLRLGFPAASRNQSRDQSRNQCRTVPRERPRRFNRTVLAEEQGAVTAEYALIITAAVAFAGLLIIILRSDEVRSSLLSIVQNALSSGG